VKRSRDRILTTHAGSLPRPADLLARMQATGAGQPGDRPAYTARVRSAVADVVERLAGFAPSAEPGELPWAGSREVTAFPEFYMGPRVHDMELRDVVDIILTVRAGAYSFEAANPRHEHEWRVWETVALPEGALLIPGVITQSTVLVEHPELVAERIVRFATVVGRENVIAGADCGFATFAGSTEIHPTVAWAKLKSLADGARLATKTLWGRA